MNFLPRAMSHTSSFRLNLCLELEAREKKSKPHGVDFSFRNELHPLLPKVAERREVDECFIRTQNDLFVWQLSMERERERMLMRNSIY